MLTVHNIGQKPSKEELKKIVDDVDKDGTSQFSNVLF